jgi:hypothetical protein
VAEHPLGSEVVALARRVNPAALRSLDAIHLVRWCSRGLRRRCHGGGIGHRGAPGPLPRCGTGGPVRHRAHRRSVPARRSAPGGRLACGAGSAAHCQRGRTTVTRSRSSGWSASATP